MTLWELKSEYMELLSMMEDPDVDPEVLKDTMEGIEGEIEVKLDAYMIVRKELEAEKAKWDAKKERAEKHSTVLANNITRLNQATMEAMRLVGKDKLPTEHFKLAIQKNGGLQPLKITGEVPEVFQILEPKPDMRRIREALNEGFELDWAHLEERGVHLSVR